MALIVEDGSGLPNAESYISVVDADTYFANRGNAAWAALDTATKEQSLRAATDYMAQTFRLRWVGMRVTVAQSLDWPRAWVPIPDSPGGYRASPAYMPLNVVPSEVSRACAELAVRSSAAELSPDLTTQVTRETVGPITVEYAQGARQAPYYHAVEALLAPYLKARGGLDVVRA